MRRPIVATLAALLVALAVAPAPGSATAYRYWTYWTSVSAGEWEFAQLGPASTRPGDGGVEGWRFAVSTGTNGDGSQPRIMPGIAFQQFCGDRSAPDGHKRVAVVFDFGSTADAPSGQQPPPARGTCVVIEADATGSEVLAEAADVRVEDGMVCAIAGYPQGECAPSVPTPSPTPEASDRPRDDDRPARERDRDPEKEASRGDPVYDTPDTTAPDTSSDSGDTTDTRQPERKPPAKQQPAPLPRGIPGGTTNVGASPKGVVPAAPQPALPSTSATAAPVFTEGEAREAGDDTGAVRALLGIAALAGLVGVIGWRRSKPGSS